MILGIGIDLIEIARIEAAMRNPRFIERVLTSNERKRVISAERLAGRWAAKEAIAKAIGRSIAWHDVEIANTATGAPNAIIAAGILPDTARVHLSISHSKTHATAVVTIEVEDSAILAP